MDQNYIIETFILIGSDKYIQLSASVIAVFALLIAFFLSPLAGTVIGLSYISGFVASWFLIKNQAKTSTYLLKLLNFYQEKVSLVQKVNNSCSVCDDLSCKRHQLTKSLAPWKHLVINKDLNSAIEHFYNRILDNFVKSWYTQFTDDRDFVNELQYCLKYASATLINRYLELDAGSIIANKLIPCGVKHIDDYLYMQQIAKLKNVHFNKEVVSEYLGKQLHIATVNRKYELKYLQELCTAVMRQVLPETYLRCRNFSVLIREIVSGWVLLPLMDVLADPNIINSLVIIAVNYKSIKHTKHHQSVEEVEFLHNFVEIDSNKKSPFSTNLNRIKNNTDLLYAFMQFLKKQEHVHLLQFCLDVDEFNSKLLTPDLTKKQLKELHEEALRLNKEYFEEKSPNFINCSRELSESFSYLIEDIYSVAKLRTSKPLYQAYDYTYNVLETVWLPPFFHSNEFYSYICGSNATSTYKKAPIKSALYAFSSPSKERSKKYYDQLSANPGAVSKLSSGLGKIRGVLKSAQPIDGAFFPQGFENGAVDEIILDDCKHLFRDLNTWKVTIPSYQANTSNKIVYFCMNVQRSDIAIDDSKSKWYVWRKDQDFYTLKAKLVEFHGEQEICDSPLPSRKAGSPIESRMLKYEEFVLKLLKKPTLRGSDLLYTFLTTEEDFTMVITTMAPNVQDIGNIYQSVAHKLRKEKGQHLDTFMSAFLTSTVRQKSDKLDVAEEGEELDDLTPSACKSRPLPTTYKNHIFGDNFGLSHKPTKDTSSSSFVRHLWHRENGKTYSTMKVSLRILVHVGKFRPLSRIWPRLYLTVFKIPMINRNLGSTTYFQTCFFLVRNIFKVPNGVLKMYVAVCSVSQQLVDFCCKIFIERKLRSGLCQTNLAYLIKLLEDVIFTHHISPTKEELERRKQRAQNDIRSVCPNGLNKMLGGQISNGLAELLEILQNPHYNKQLAFNLLDIICLEMFPQLGEEEK